MLLWSLRRCAAGWPCAGAGQFVADRHLRRLPCRRRSPSFLARLARAHDAAFGIVFVRGLGDAVEVEIGGELHARAAGADHRGDDRFDLVAQAAFVGRLALVGAGAVERVGLCGAVGEQPAGLVDHRHALGLEAVDRGGDQMADGAHLLRLQRAAHLEHDRGGRLDLVAREQRPVRQNQMHARGLHPVDAADGAGEFAFERAQMVDVLDEAGGAERVRLVENLVADAAAFGQAAFGELHAQPRDLVLGHQHDGAVVLDLVGDRLALEILDDRGRVLEREVGEQRRHLRRRHPDNQE